MHTDDLMLKAATTFKYENFVIEKNNGIWQIISSIKLAEWEKTEFSSIGYDSFRDAFDTIDK